MATGSVPRKLGYQSIRPDITAHPGVEQENVLFAKDAILQPGRVGQKVLLSKTVSRTGRSCRPLSTCRAGQAGGDHHFAVLRARIGSLSIGKLYGKLFKLGVKITPMTGFIGIEGKTATLFHTFTNEQRHETTHGRPLLLQQGHRRPLLRSKGKVKELVRVGDCLPRATRRRLFAKANSRPARCSCEDISESCSRKDRRGGRIPLPLPAPRRDPRRVTK